MDIIFFYFFEAYACPLLEDSKAEVFNLFEGSVPLLGILLAGWEGLVADGCRAVGELACSSVGW